MSYKILDKNHEDEEPHEVTAPFGWAPFSGIQSYEAAVARASEWMMSSHPDWDDSVLVIDEQTGKHCFSITLTLVRKDLRNEQQNQHHHHS